MSRPTQVLVQNTGATGASTTYANPSEVPAGVIAAFDENGTGLDMSAAAPAKFQLVLGHDVQPIITPIITKASAQFFKLDYVAPVRNSITITGIPVGPTGGAVYGIITTNLNAPREQFTRDSFDQQVTAGKSVENIIAEFISQMNTANRQDYFTARSNYAKTETLSGTSGTANITVEGVNYLATFDTDLTTTADNFVTSHAATIAAAHDITVVAASGVLTFTRGSTQKGGVFTVVSTNVSGDLDGASAVSQAQDALILDAATLDDILQLAFQEHLSTVTITQTKTSGVRGSGSYAHINELELKARGTTGRYYVDDGILGSLEDPPVFAVSGNNYDMYTILNQNDQDDNINRAFKYAELILAFATGVTGTLNTFLGVS